MVFNSSNRLLIGLFLLIIVLFSYLLKLDHILFFLTLAFITYDFYKIKTINNSNIYLLLTITVIVIFFLPYNTLRYLFVLEIVLVLLIFFNTKYKILFFLLSIYIFCLILFHIVNLNRDIFYIIIFVSFFNDTIAYLSGKKIGGPPIIPSISPNKTWSGTTISFFLTTIVLFLLDFNLILSAILSIFYFFGDIFFSYIKRNLNIKDFSLSLGGHGGVLDRLDSMFFVTIIFQIYLVKII